MAPAPHDDEDARLDLVFAALADSTRRAMLARLAEGDATLNELAEPFDMSLQAVSKHLKVLERAGLVTRTRDAQRRPARVELAALESASGWIDEHRKVWEGRLDALGGVIADLQRARSEGPPDEGATDGDAPDGS